MFSNHGFVDHPPSTSARFGGGGFVDDDSDSFGIHKVAEQIREDIGRRLRLYEAHS